VVRLYVQDAPLEEIWARVGAIRSALEAVVISWAQGNMYISRFQVSNYKSFSCSGSAGNGEGVPPLR